MTIWGVLTTLHTSVATLDDKKSRTGPARSLHSSGKIFDEQPRITWASASADGTRTGRAIVGESSTGGVSFSARGDKTRPT